MKDDKREAAEHPPQANGSLPNRILGSLRDALNAASRDDRTGARSGSRTRGSGAAGRCRRAMAALTHSARAVVRATRRKRVDQQRFGE